MRAVMKNLVCLISGRGSNLAALLAAAREERWEQRLDARFAAVISNKPQAAGLAIAAAAGVPTRVVAHGDFGSRDAFDRALMVAIDAHQPALVVLAGFMRVLTEGFVTRYAGRLINIHPSLLPSFTGLHTHERALEAGCKVHGATVHFVTPELDHGPIILQAAVPVLPDDTPETLAERVLAQEHVIYPRAVRWFAEGLLEVEDGIVRVNSPKAAQLVMAR